MFQRGSPLGGLGTVCAADRPADLNAAGSLGSGATFLVLREAGGRGSEGALRGAGLTAISCATSTEVLRTVSAIIDAGASINLYMFHGGTNFGFINGAMHFQDYMSDVTSYGKFPLMRPWDTRLSAWALEGSPSGTAPGTFNAKQGFVWRVTFKRPEL